MVELFRGRQLVIATMHGKERVIAPILEKALGVRIQLIQNFNTDFYGQFSGEIVRELSPLEAAKAKAKSACEHTGSTLAIASEGSFGAHPTLFFMPADEEILVLLDLENNICISAKVLSTNTNFCGESIPDWQNAKAFADKIGFPEHALILRKTQGDNVNLIKGIKDWDLLEQSFLEYSAKYGSAFLETDMRAMHNPTRMTVIEQVTHKLVEKILNDCPRCKTAGYDICEVVTGLPCAQCKRPTDGVLAYQYKCASCKYTSVKEFPDGKIEESPQYCNP